MGCGSSVPVAAPLVDVVSVGVGPSEVDSECKSTNTLDEGLDQSSKIENRTESEDNLDLYKSIALEAGTRCQDLEAQLDRSILEKDRLDLKVQNLEAEIRSLQSTLEDIQATANVSSAPDGASSANGTENVVVCTDSSSAVMSSSDAGVSGEDLERGFPLHLKFDNQSAIPSSILRARFRVDMLQALGPRVSLHELHERFGTAHTRLGLRQSDRSFSREEVIEAMGVKGMDVQQLLVQENLEIKSMPEI